MKINSKEYWNDRFSSGDWTAKGGENQTFQFSQSQARFLVQLPNCRTLLDFGCGTGEAFQTYRSVFPDAKLFGVDHAPAAIDIARAKFSTIADFSTSVNEHRPQFDYVICSNVLEHVEDPDAMARDLLRYASQAVIIVTPYKEKPFDSEHVNRFSDSSFADLNPSQVHVFKSPGWTEYGRSLVYHVYFLNILRFLTGKPTRRRRMQVMYILPSHEGQGQIIRDRERDSFSHSRRLLS